MDEDIARPRAAADRMASGAYAALLWGPGLLLAGAVVAVVGSFSHDATTWFLVAGVLGLAGVVTAVAGGINAIEAARDVASLSERASIVTLRELPPTS